MPPSLTVALLLALVLTGLLAGLFFAFTVAVMPGLRRTDDRTFTATMRAINTAIRNPPFGVVFAGAPLTSVVAAVLSAVEEPGSPVALLSGAGAALALAQFAVTVAANIPLNNRLEAAGTATDAREPTAARLAFEAPWTRWNTLRSVLGTAATACLALALAGAAP